MHHALKIANTPGDTWAEQIQRIPNTCPTPDECGRPHNCRDRNASYLRTQWRMKGQRTKAGRA